MMDSVPPEVVELGDHMTKVNKITIADGSTIGAVTTENIQNKSIRRHIPSPFHSLPPSLPPSVPLHCIIISTRVVYRIHLPTQCVKACRHE